MTAFIEALIVSITITLPLSFLVGAIISIVAHSNIETRWKADKLFSDSTAGGFVGGSIGGLIGQYLGSESASQVDGMFIGLSGIGEVINYFQIFLPCWILSTLGGAIFAVDFLNKDTK